ncbi:MAG: efflux RND transporter periplasmic adaptor subunit [Muribaculaceae bacterium]|nr:efflux RND transporter periplasmic adaptor subunit [Muribaculaceae bacterium]
MVKYILKIAVTTAIAVGMTACGGSEHAEHDHDHEHSHAEEAHAHDHNGHDHEHGEEADAHGHGHGDEIKMEPEVAERFGVTVERVSLKPFSEVVKVSGQILPAAGDRSAVSATSSGIFKLKDGITVGSQVSAGQAIGTISARGLQGGDAVEAARVELEAAEAELKRLEPLVADGIVSRKEYNEALARVKAARAAYNGGGKAASGTVVATAGGVVTELAATSGEYVETGQLIAVVAQNRNLTLRADLPRRYYSFLPHISTANFRPDYSTEVLTLASLDGRLLSREASNTGAYIPVYFTFSNRGGVVPGAAAEVYLVGSEKAEALTVPVSAIVEIQGKQYVYTRVHDDAYAKNAVTIGGSDGVNVEILSGLKPGDTVVATGARVVQMAESANVAPPGHSHNH